MPKPIILITAGKQGLDAQRREMQSVSSCCSMQYVNAVVRAGGAPVLLPCVAETEAIGAVLEAVEGVVLTGGGDILSLAYGEEPHLAAKYQDSTRDEMELEVTRRAWEAGLPLLGICRGIQVLNVALGGTLIQDVPSQVPGAIQHYAYGLEPLLLHSIEIEPDSRLAQVVGARSMRVNSYHHQAVNALGEGIRVNSRAPDGVVEGIEAVDGRPVLGVQFHPEELAERFPSFQSLFDWVVAEAGSRRKGDVPLLT